MNNETENSRIWIIVPIFHGGDIARNFVRQINEQSYENWFLVIVDHGEEGTLIPEIIKNKTVILRGSSKLWWTGAVNIGLKHALALANDDDRILIINYDITISNGYLAHLLAASKNRPAAVIGSVCVDEITGLIVSAGHKMHWLSAKMKGLYKECNPLLLANKSIQADVLSGRGMMGSVAVFLKAGLFEEKLAHYGADLEYTWRVKKLGFKLLCDGNSVVATLPKSETLYAFQRDVNSFYNNVKKPGNFCVQVQLAKLCFGLFYRYYYIGMHFIYMSGSLVKRFLMQYVFKSQGNND